MATISSAGIGSGLDVNSIVTQLVAIEKKPLATLTLKATSLAAQVSTFGQVQSQFSILADVAARIAVPSTWSARNASTSNSSAATITVTSAANATSFQLDVDALASNQSVSSAQLTAGAAVGAGTLTLQLGTWSGSGAAFAQKSGNVAVNVAVTATDTVSDIASKINTANAGVVATAFNDGTSDRLLLRSKDTGAVSGFKLTVADASDGLNNDNSGLSRLAFDPSTVDPLTSNASGMASAGLPVQYGQDAKARINGLAVTSASNTLTGNIPGVTFKLLNTTTTGYGGSSEVKVPITMSISEDVTPAVKNVSDFVAAYNTLNQTLNDLTKYVASTKTAGLFQGDSSVVNLQNMLRNMLSSSSYGGSTQRLSDVGLERVLDGSISMNTAKLSVAANNGTSLMQLFTANNSNASTNGFALKFRDLGKGLIGSGGAVANKVVSIQSELDRNAKAQTSVNDKATLFEARLRKQYSTLDAKMAQLNALNTYVSQQVTTWNKSTA
jgi:flagellar hook-associated protein 2